MVFSPPVTPKGKDFSNEENDDWIVQCGIFLIIFLLLADKPSKRYLVFEEFSKEFSLFKPYLQWYLFFPLSLRAMSEKGILKENSVAMIKRNICRL